MAIKCPVCDYSYDPSSYTSSYRKSLNGLTPPHFVTKGIETLNIECAGTAKKGTIVSVEEFDVQTGVLNFTSTPNEWRAR